MTCIAKRLQDLDFKLPKETEVKERNSILKNRFSKEESLFNYHNQESDKFVPWMMSSDT